MTQRKKKFLTAVPIVAALLLAGCAGGDDTTGGEDGQITLTFQSWEASPLESASIAAGLKGFEDSHPNVTVKYVTAPFAQHHTKLKTQMASGTAPDVFYLNPDYQRDFADAGQLLDLTPYFDDYWDLDDFLPSSQEKIQVTEGGETKIYGVDVCTVGPVLFYNKDLFDEAGVEYPPTDMADQWTWDEFVTNMQRLTKAEDGKTVQYGTANFEEQMNLYTTQEMVASNGAQWFNDDFTEAVGMDSPESREALERIKSLRTEGIAPDPSAIGLDSTNSPTQMLLTGKVASLYMGSYGLQELAASEIDLGAGLPPKMDGDFYPMESCNVDAVWAGTEHPQEAIELVTYLTSMDFATPLYESGLWMPNRLSMYEGENLATWYDEDVYPEGWIDMQSLWTEGHLRWFDKLRNTEEVYTITTEELQDYFYNDAPLDTILPRMQDRVNAAMSK